MKKLLLLFVCIALGAGTASAVVLDFENLPLDYYYFYGQQNIGGYYPGVNFGPTLYILDRVIGGYNDGGYPPCSGNAVAVSIGTDFIRADFASVTDYVSVCYTSGTGPLYLEGYTAGGALVDSDSGPENYGSNNVIAISGANIAYVIIHDSGDFFTIDDFTFNMEPTPTQESTWGTIKNLYR